MNLSQFRTSVSSEIGLDNNASTEQGIIDDAVNAGVLRVLEDTHCYVNEASMTGFDGSSTDFTIDTNVFEFVDLYSTSGGSNYRLERVSINELIERKRSILVQSAPTQIYAINGENMVQFWPAPGASDTMTVYYVPKPTALSASGDDPSSVTLGGIPSYFHQAIKYWAFSECASYDDDQSSAQGQRYRQEYDQEIVRLRKHMRRRGGNRNQRAVVNDVKRRRGLHDNSTYPRY